VDGGVLCQSLIILLRIKTCSVCQDIDCPTKRVTLVEKETKVILNRAWSGYLSIGYKSKYQVQAIAGVQTEDLQTLSQDLQAKIFVVCIYNNSTCLGLPKPYIRFPVNSGRISTLGDGGETALSVLHQKTVLLKSAYPDARSRKSK